MTAAQMRNYEFDADPVHPDDLVQAGNAELSLVAFEGGDRVRGMKAIGFVVVACSLGVGAGAAVEFEKPVRFKAGGEFVRVESPGYASPCWADIDGDGKKDLLVGQFRDGKIRVFKGLGGEKLAKGEWLKANGNVAKVPGVW